MRSWKTAGRGMLAAADGVGAAPESIGEIRSILDPVRWFGGGTIILLPPVFLLFG